KNGFRTCLIKGRPGTLGTSNNVLNIIVKKTTQGFWLYADTNSNGNFIEEGFAADTTLIQGNFAGYYFKFTSTNSKNFYADDFYMGQSIVDKEAPKLESLTILNSSSISLQFNEKINLGSNQQIVLNQQISPISWQQVGFGLNLQFDKEIEKDLVQTLSLNGISDMEGNLLDTSVSFIYHPIKIGDILITEIFPDPDPSQGLPDAEFIEIWNASNFPIDLIGFILSDASSNCVFPNKLLMPQEYLILCEVSDTNSFKNYGQVLGLNGFPSLNNSGDIISLKTASQMQMQLHHYDLSWYQNKQKEIGGFSLELINPKKLCTGKNNWQASNNLFGGTPGIVNSTWDTLPDIYGPKINSVIPINKNQIQVYFDEAIVFPNLAEKHFMLNQKPIKAIVFDTNKTQEIIITSIDTLINLSINSIQINGIADCAGNTRPQSFDFQFFDTKTIEARDLLIHEIYYDTEKKGNFPEAEYIELRNVSSYALNLKGLQFSDAVSSTILPNYFLKPDSFLILCHKDYEQDFLSLAPTIGLYPFPSLNTSDKLSLNDSNGFLIHQVNYTEDWFKQKPKVSACSIEMIDPKNACGKKENWGPSTSDNGATPGKMNSIAANNPDKTSPKFQRLYAANPHEIYLYFNEAIDSISLGSNQNFVLNQSLFASDFRFINNTPNQLQISFSEPLDSGIHYQLQILNLQDCAANTLEEAFSESFMLPIEPKKGELAFNEILFNPKPNYYDYIEILNLSPSYLDLKNVSLFGFDNSGERTDAYKFGENNWMIAPQSYLAITLSQETLKQQFNLAQENQIISHTIPSMNDDEGTLIIVNQKNETLDSIYYTEKMHLGFLNQKDGVSLEKINPYLPSWNANNWSSAAEEKEFGTPTQKNSIYENGGNKNAFQPSRLYFSPDGDGQDDVMVFGYQLAEVKKLGSLYIYNSLGQLIKTLCQSKILAETGEVNWFGDDENGQKVGIGQYLAVWEIFSEDGSKSSKRIGFALLGK
ncbi:MAG: lamin tail domain-containing protein, partial [Bacteroidia bacterium]|nr:lamin tail domain-containing protein [Bacteroidia bacterium]